MAQKNYWVIRIQIVKQVWDEDSPTNDPISEEVEKQVTDDSFETEEEADNAMNNLKWRERED